MILYQTNGGLTPYVDRAKASESGSIRWRNFTAIEDVAEWLGCETRNVALLTDGTWRRTDDEDRVAD